MATDAAAMEGILEVEKERSEESQEILKTIHKPMRKWYKTQPADFKKKYGRFPLFWQDLKPWKSWDDVYKAYMIATEDKGAGSALRKLTKVTKETPEAESSANKSTSAIGGDASATTLAVTTSSTGDAVAPSDAAQAAPAAASTAEGDKVPTPRKRKSRWSTEAAPKAKTRSRWGAAETSPTPGAGSGNAAAAKPGLDAQALGNMAKLGLAPEQLQIMKLRLRLTEIDMKLQNVQNEAAQLANDPNRSPSPEPETDPATGTRRRSCCRCCWCVL